jgi:hypothetical protein
MLNKLRDFEKRRAYERTARASYAPTDMSNIQRGGNEPWERFMARMRNEFRRRKNIASTKRARTNNTGRSSPMKAVRTSPPRRVPASTSPSASTSRGSARTDPAAVTRSALRKKSNLDAISKNTVKAMLQRAGFVYPPALNNLNATKPGFSAVQKHAVWPMLHPTASKRQQFDRSHLRTGGSSNGSIVATTRSGMVQIPDANAKKMLEYMNLGGAQNHVKEIDSTTKLQLLNTILYGSDTTKAALKNEFERRRARASRPPKPLPPGVSRQGGGGLLAQLQAMNHATLLNHARTHGFRLNHWNALPNEPIIKKKALPIAVYDQVHQDASRRNIIKTTPQLLSKVPAGKKHSTAAERAQGKQQKQAATSVFKNTLTQRYADAARRPQVIRHVAGVSRTAANRLLQHGIGVEAATGSFPNSLNALVGSMPRNQIRGVRSALQLATGEIISAKKRVNGRSVEKTAEEQRRDVINALRRRL